jgi:hypothetical protein
MQKIQFGPIPDRPQKWSKKLKSQCWKHLCPRVWIWCGITISAPQETIRTNGYSLISIKKAPSILKIPFELWLTTVPSDPIASGIQSIRATEREMHTIQFVSTANPIPVKSIWEFGIFQNTTAKAMRHSAESKSIQAPIWKKARPQSIRGVKMIQIASERQLLKHDFPRNSTLHGIENTWIEERASASPSICFNLK